MAWLRPEKCALHFDAKAARVYLGGTKDRPSWRGPVEGLTCPRILKREGPEPNEAHLVLERGAGDGPGFPAEVIEMRAGRDASGTWGKIPCPAGIDRGEWVKVVYADRVSGKEGDIAFLGFVVAWTFDLDAARADIAAYDGRWLMGAAPVFGRHVFRPYSASKDETWTYIENAFPIFNEDGKANQMSNDAGRWPYFITADYDGADETFTSAHSRLGDALNYFREWWNVQESKDGYVCAHPTSHYLVWPEAEEGGDWSWLFYAPETGEERLCMDFRAGAMSLSRAIDALVRSAGAYGWTLGIDQKSEKFVLRLFSLVYGAADAETWDLRRGDISKGLSAQRPDVETGYGAALAVHPPRANGVRVIAAKKRVEFTFDTVAESLAEGWDSTEQTAYVAAVVNAAGTDEYNQKYPNCGLRWIVPKTYDFTAVAGSDGWERRARETLARLLSSAADAEGRDGEPVRLELLVWRSKDAGATWEKLSVGKPHPLRDALGFVLSADARNKNNTLGEAFTWNQDAGSPAFYDMRVTLAFEIEERLASSGDDRHDGERRLGAVFKAPDYRYDRRLAGTYLPLDGSGDPVLQGGTDGATTAASVLRDDTTKVSAIAVQRLEELNRTRYTGALPVPGLHVGVELGDFVGTLKGGGTRYGVKREDIPLDAVIREIVLDAAVFQTRFSFGG